MKKLAGKKSSGSSDQQTVQLKAIIFTIAVLVVAVAISVASSLLIRHPNIMQSQDIADTVSSSNYFLANIGLSILNVILVLYLIYLYVSDYLSLKSNFTLGLLAVLFSFLLYALSTLPIHGLGFEEGMEAFNSVIPLIFSAIGLIIFIKISRE